MKLCRFGWDPFFTAMHSHVLCIHMSYNYVVFSIIQPNCCISEIDNSILYIQYIYIYNMLHVIQSMSSYLRRWERVETAPTDRHRSNSQGPKSCDSSKCPWLGVENFWLPTTAVFVFQSKAHTKYVKHFLNPETLSFFFWLRYHNVNHVGMIWIIFWCLESTSKLTHSSLTAVALEPIGGWSGRLHRIQQLSHWSSWVLWFSLRQFMVIQHHWTLILFESFWNIT